MIKREEAVNSRKIEIEENIVTDVQYLIQDILDEKGLTRADLAKLSGMSKPRITQLLRDEANPTVKTLAVLFDALGEELSVARKNKSRMSDSAQPDLVWSDFDFASDSKNSELSKLDEIGLEEVISASIDSALASKKRYKKISYAANDNPLLQELLEMA